MKKPKTLETKLRSAIRLIWSRSKERREIVKQAQYPAGIVTKYYAFLCPVCAVEYPIQMAEVDHDPPLGTFDNWHKVEDYISRMFFGPQRAICKLCHKQKTAAQRRKHA
jgi:hypothetical protein